MEDRKNEIEREGECTELDEMAVEVKVPRRGRSARNWEAPGEEEEEEVESIAGEKRFQLLVWLGSVRQRREEKRSQKDCTFSLSSLFIYGTRNGVDSSLTRT